MIKYIIYRILYDCQANNRTLCDNFSMENPELKRIQVRLREVIKQSGIPQKVIAREIGVSAQTVSKYMRADVFPALDTLAKLCKLLDVKSDYVLGITEY